MGTLFQGHRPAAFQLLVKEEKEAPIANSTTPLNAAHASPLCLHGSVPTSWRHLSQWGGVTTKLGTPWRQGLWGPLPCTQDIFVKRMKC